MTCDLCGKTDEVDEDVIGPQIIWWTLGPAYFCSQLCWTYFKCPTRESYLIYIKESQSVYHPPVEKKDDWNVLKAALYEPNFNHAVGQEFTSYRDEQKKVKEWNDKQDGEKHPRKFSFANDDHKMMEDCKYSSKHRDEWKVANYPGYKPHSGQWDSNKREMKNAKRKTYSFPK